MCEKALYIKVFITYKTLSMNQTVLLPTKKEVIETGRQSLNRRNVPPLFRLCIGVKKCSEMPGCSLSQKTLNDKRVKLHNNKPETEVMRSTEQLLRNPDIAPSSYVIAKALGEANNAYIKFINELANHGIQLEWRYYNDVKAWLAKGLYKWTGVRGGQNEKTILWLSVWDGFFKVTIYFPEKSRADVLSLPLDNEIKLMIADARQMGKLKYFPLVFDLCSDEKFEAVFLLADFRKSINRR